MARRSIRVDLMLAPPFVRPRPRLWRLGLLLLLVGDALGSSWCRPGGAVPCWALRRLPWHVLAWPGADVCLACAAVAASTVCSPRCVLLLLSHTCATSSPSTGCLGIHGTSAAAAVCVLLLLCCCSCGCACAAAMLILLWLCLCCCYACYSTLSTACTML
jgi:hypothetical protein